MSTGKVGFLDEQEFIHLRDAAKLSGIHPAILEMARTLLKKPGEQAGYFQLATPALVKQASDIQKVFVRGLVRVAKALNTSQYAVVVKTGREKDRLAFWYEARKKKAGGR